MPDPLQQARQILAELLSDWEVRWLLWPASHLAPKLSPSSPAAWFSLTGPAHDWAQQVQAFHHCQAGRQDPLLVVLEMPHDQDRLQALQSLATPLPWLVVLLLDPQSSLPAVPSHTGGWFQRTSEPPAYAWPCWLRQGQLEFWGSLDLEDPKAIGERLDELMTGVGRRLLHLYGPPQPLNLKTPERRNLISAPGSLESAFLAQLPDLLQESTLLIWGAPGSAPPTALICHPSAIASAAWGAHRAGYFPVVALSAGDLGEALHGMLDGLPPGSLLLILEAGLCWQPGEAYLAPGRLRDLALLRQVHGLALTCPADVAEAAELLRLSYQTETPFAIRLTHAPAVHTGLGSTATQAGRSHCLRQGQHAAILALGPMVYPSLLAAESLASWGLDCQVWDMRFLKPLDRDALEVASSTGHILTVEEHCLQGGLATMVLETLSPMQLSPRLAHLALPATPPIAAAAHLEEFGLDADGIQRAVRSLLGLAAPML